MMQNSLGPLHKCFQAVEKEVVNHVYLYLLTKKVRIIRKPVLVPEYSAGYYTIDFYDPNGYVLEVAYTPNMIL